MKRMLAFSFLIMFASFAVFACGDSETASAEDSSETSSDFAIRVNDETISDTQLEERIDMQIRPMLQRFGVESTDELPPQAQGLRDQVKRRVVQQSTTQLILLSYAKKSDVTVSDQELEDRWNQLVNRFPSKEQFQKQLEQMGRAPEDFREDLRHSMLIEKYAEQEIGEIKVSDEEIENHFSKNKDEYGEAERVKARHILFEEEDGNDPEAEAREVKEKIEGGADFAEMAKKHSDGPSAERGGSLGTFSKGEMVPAFEEVAFSLEPGTISDPVQTRFGYHLIEIEDKMDSKPADLEGSREEIRQQLTNQKRRQKMQQLVQRLRDKADIEQKIEMPQPPQPQGQPGTGQGQAVPGQPPGQ